MVAALLGLRPDDREILWLRLWEELPPAVVAEVLGISRAAVDQRLSRARRRLSLEMRRSLDTHPTAGTPVANGLVPPPDADRA